MFVSCNKQEEGVLKIEIKGLPELGENFAYEGWIIVDGSPQTDGIFTVDSEGRPGETCFELDKKALSEATAYVLTIEPMPDPEPKASAVHVLGGDFSKNTAELFMDHKNAIGSDLMTHAGSFTLHERNGLVKGLWFEDLSGSPSLNFEEINTGWDYESWIRFGDDYTSMGKFQSLDEDDDSAFDYAEQKRGVPGEHFFYNPNDTVDFPSWDL